MPVIETLESLSMKFVAPRLRGVSRLIEALPRLQQLAIESPSMAHADTTLSTTGLRSLTLALPTLPEWVRPAEAPRELSIHIATAEGVSDFLDACPATSETLSLRGTPVDDALLERLARFRALRYVDVVDTRGSTEALDEFVRARPGMRYLPWRLVVPRVGAGS